MATQTQGPTPSQSLALYERMLLIRRMEEKLSADSAAGVLPGAVHLYIGQEAVAAGVCMQLQDTGRGIRAELLFHEPDELHALEERKRLRGSGRAVLG